MLKLFWFVFWAGLSLLAIAAGVSLRTRVRHASDAERPLVDDDAVRAILETGRLITSDDEPLDIAEIEREERRFWSEDWEEPDQW
jgi:uncharacterized membrane protein